jgi:hypothetical protein
MLSPLNHRWRSVRAVLGLIVIGCLAVDAAIAMAAGSNPEHWERVGLERAYTYESCSSTSVVDPIDVVWYGGGPVPGGVGAVLSKHGWDENDYQDPTLQALEQLGLGGVDRQYVHEIGTTEGAEECFGDDTQRATGNPFGNRNHVRLFSTVNRNKKLFVVGDAHHDKVVFFHGCEQAIIGGHIASNYNGAREAIASIWPVHTALHYWGNNRPIRQCNGSYTHSDGRVLYASAVVAGAAGYHPIDTEKPQISGSPAVGSTLTVSPGQWTGSPAAFLYQWCYIDAEDDTCTPIAGATSSTWIPQASNLEEVVAVLVRPVGSSPIDAVLSNAVLIHGEPPTAVTESYEFPSETTVKLFGTVNPNGAPTTYHFEYGPTAEYGASSPSESAGSGTSPVKVSAEVPAELEEFFAGAIKPDVILCRGVVNPQDYRLVASSAAGTTSGENQGFPPCVF